MQLLKKYGIIFFWLLLFADCFLVYTGDLTYHTYIKAAMVPLLMLYIFLNARKKYYLVSKSLVFMGLFFAWLGDMILLNNSNSFFMVGMGCFFAMNIFFIIFFFRIHPLNIFKATEGTIAAIGMFIVLYKLYGFMQSDLSQMPNLRIFLLTYGLTISIMVVLAANTFDNRVKRPMVMNYFIPGAVLLVLAHAALVVYKFKYPDESYLQVVTTISYGYGICLLSQGFCKHLKG
jgi:uncharacterized membrane protein YhhN